MSESGQGQRPSQEPRKKHGAPHGSLLLLPLMTVVRGDQASESGLEPMNERRGRQRAWESLKGGQEAADIKSARAVPAGI